MRRDDDVGAQAIFLETGLLGDERKRAPVDEPPHAAELVAIGSKRQERASLTAIAIGAQPLLRLEGIGSRPDHSELAVRETHRRAFSRRRDRDIEAPA